MLLPKGHVVNRAMLYLGWPVVALSIGVLIAYRNTKHDQAHARVSDWIENALRTSAMMIMVVGLGGALSQILRQTPAVDAIARAMEATGLPAIFLPFVLGIVGNMITGSTTVGVITSASIVAPMMPALGLSPEATMLAASAGGIITKYVNSSYFWVCTSLTRMPLRSALDLVRGSDDRKWRGFHGRDLHFVVAPYHLTRSTVTAFDIPSTTDAPSARRTTRAPYAALALIGLGGLFSGVTGPLISAFVPPLVRDALGEHRTAIGAVMAIDNVLLLLLVPWAGPASDRATARGRGRLPLVLTGFVLSSVGMALFPPPPRSARGPDRRPGPSAHRHQHPAIALSGARWPIWSRRATAPSRPDRSPSRCASARSCS